MTPHVVSYNSCAFLLREEVDFAPETSRPRRSVDLPRRHRVLKREPDAAVNSDLLRIDAPGVRAADDFAEFGADSLCSKLCAADRAQADGEVAIVTNKDG